MTSPISRPGRIELTIGLLLLAGIVGTGLGLALARSTPVAAGVTVAPNGLDFGSVWEQPAYRHEFELTNPTDGPIRVAEIRTGCGCTRVEPQSFTLEPGETKSLVATLDFTGRGGSSFAVDLLPLLAHQPPGDRTVWTLRGKVRKNPIALAEPSLDFGDDVILGEPRPTREVEVTLVGKARFDELSAHIVEGQGSAELEATDAGLGVREGEAPAVPEFGVGAEFRRSGSAGASPSRRPASRENGPKSRRWRLRVTPPEGLLAGSFRFTVRLTSTSADANPLGATGSASANGLPASHDALAKPVARPSSTTSSPVPFRDILVTGTVRDDVAAWPATVNFGVLEVGDTGREYVVLSSHRGRPFEVTKIDSPEGATVTLADEQLDDGSKTLVVEQTAREQGDQKAEIVFLVRRERPDENASAELSIRIQTSIYGMSTNQ